MSRIDIEAARERIVQLEDVDGVLRSDLLQIRDRVEGTENGIGLVRKQLAHIEMYGKQYDYCLHNGTQKIVRSNH